MKLPFDPSPWLSFLDPPPTPLLGVDISSSSVKVVELSRRRGGELVYDGHAIEPLPADVAAHRDGSTNSEALNAALAQIVGQAVKKLRSHTRQVAVGMPANMVISKPVDLSEQLDEADIADEASREIGKAIAFPLDEVFIDWDVLGPSAHRPGDMQVLICASRRERVLERQAIIELSGLRAKVIDVDSHASRRAFERAIAAKGLSERVCCVVDAGARNTHVMFLQGGELLFEREVTLGGEALIEEILRGENQRGKRCSRDEAERVVQGEREQLFEGYESRYLRPFIANLSSEIARVSQYFLTQASAENVDAILLAGGASRLPGLAEAVKDRCAVETSSLDLLAGIEIPGRWARSVETDGSRLAVALGLALRRFDPPTHD
jgi:type IV pilus assembly protein PilM